jgi:SAM-dependent methyltransferase
MTSDPFLERLRAHASAPRASPAFEEAEDPGPVPRPAGGAWQEPAVASGPGGSAPRTGVRADQLSFWQSQVVREALNRRITGDARLTPEADVARRYAGSLPAPLAISLRAGDVQLEVAMVQEGGCERVVGLDPDPERADLANLRVPAALREQIRFRSASLDDWSPDAPVGGVLARSVLHRQAGLEGILDRVREVLAPGGLLIVDDYVGPARFQWSDAQLEIINRLLACLPRDLLTDLTAADGRSKRRVERPDAAGFAAAHPTEAVRSSEILACLDARFERVEVRPYGGAIYHQLFSRIMGNFTDRPDLVRVLMEADALLTEAGAVPSDYLWGVWRRP